jgi:uncharacterized phage-associated protein
MIKFNFNKDKFLALMELMCQKVPDLDRLKAAKLLYFIDRASLLEYGRPILGDDYICMDFGPVPSRAYDWLKAFQDFPDSSDAIIVDRSKKSTGGYPIFVAKSEANVDVFSGTEMSCIDSILEKYGNESAKTLVNISHQHRAWLDTGRNTPIDYCLFFEDDPDLHKDAYEAMLLEQEDRDFVDDI